MDRCEYNPRRRTHSAGKYPPSRLPASYTTIQTPGADPILLDHRSARSPRHRGYEHEDTSYPPSSRNAQISRENFAREDRYEDREYTSTVNDGLEHRRVAQGPRLESQIPIVPAPRTPRQPLIRDVRPVGTLRTRNPAEGRKANFKDDDGMSRTETQRAEDYRSRRRSVAVDPESVVDSTSLRTKPPAKHPNDYPPPARSYGYADEGRDKHYQERGPLKEERDHNMPRYDDYRRPGDSRSKVPNEAPEKYTYNDGNNYQWVSSSNPRPANTRGSPQPPTQATPARGSNAAAAPQGSLSRSPGYQKDRYLEQQKHEYKHRSPQIDEERRGRSPTLRVNTNKIIVRSRRDANIPLHAPTPTRPSQWSSIFGLQDLEINDTIPTPQQGIPVDVPKKMRKTAPVREKTPTTTTRGNKAPRPSKDKEYRDTHNVISTKVHTICGDDRHSRAQTHGHRDSHPQQGRENNDWFSVYTSSRSKSKPKATSRARHSGEYKGEYDRQDPHPHPREHGQNPNPNRVREQSQTRIPNPVYEKTQVYRDDRFKNEPPKAEPKPTFTFDETAQRHGFKGEKAREVPVSIVYHRDPDDDDGESVCAVGRRYEKFS